MKQKTPTNDTEREVAKDYLCSSQVPLATNEYPTMRDASDSSAYD